MLLSMISLSTRSPISILPLQTGQQHRCSAGREASCMCRCMQLACMQCQELWHCTAMCPMCNGSLHMGHSSKRMLASHLNNASMDVASSDLFRRKALLRALSFAQPCMAMPAEIATPAIPKTLAVAGNAPCTTALAAVAEAPTTREPTTLTFSSSLMACEESPSTAVPPTTSQALSHSSSSSATAKAFQASLASCARTICK
mmetsp:Transcript_28731/g.66689  ORF Transcript_28731/g.66689 Transcript_28731/m.66689 type:complete len:201 (+) Transcript_28731:106-708(+)